MRKQTPVLWGIAIAGILALGGCGDDEGGAAGDGEPGSPTTTGVPADSGPIGLANPAAAFCEAQGGTATIVSDYGGGQQGKCELPDGSVVDEWEYFRQYHSEGDGATLANPAAVFCEDQGGTVSGDEPMCGLPDGTQVDAWEYFREQSTAGG